MRNISAILLSIILFLGSLVPKLDVEELGKIPFLFAHFEEHTIQNPKLDFFEFIKEHYFNQPSAKEENAHKNLPFFQHSVPNLVFVVNVFEELSFVSNEYCTIYYLENNVQYSHNHHAEILLTPQKS